MGGGEGTNELSFENILRDWHKERGGVVVGGDVKGGSNVSLLTLW